MTFPHILAALLFLSVPAAAAPITQTVRVERPIAGSAQGAVDLLQSSDRWVETFREADAVSSRSVSGGRRRVTFESPSVGHPHTLVFTNTADGTRFAFADDGHDVELVGAFHVRDTGVGTQVVLVVTVVRDGMLTLVPDALVQNRLGAFLEDVLEDLDRQRRRESMVLAAR